MVRKFLLAVLIGLSFSAAAWAESPGFSYDVYLKSDYGRARFWLNTGTGRFRWLDTTKKLDVEGKGTLAFPNLGPIIFFFSGEMDGYDWISISLKIYGTRATGYLAAFPVGEPVRKITSNMYDRDMRNDVVRRRRPRKRPEPKPSVKSIHPRPSEVPIATPEKHRPGGNTKRPR